MNLNKKNILFLTIVNIKNLEERGLYQDFIRELSKYHNIYVVTPIEKRFEGNTEIIQEGNVKILRVKTGNLTQTKSKIEKGFSTITLEYKYLSAIKNALPNIKFDWIIYTTPPITFNKIIKFYKKKHKSNTYLMLRDIFPQNAIDLEMMSSSGIISKYFRREEQRMYKMSDKIGCMSPANVNYLLRYNDFLSTSKVEVFPNAISPIKEKELSADELKEIKKKYKIPKEKTLFIYGGNLGKPQGIDFILDIIKSFNRIENGYLLIVGSGTEFGKIQNFLDSNELENVKLIQKLEKNEYDKLIKAADVGLIFLDKRFTIPNFPSRMTAYLENSLPILAATDKNTDIGKIIEDNNAGFWCESKEVDEFIDLANKLSKEDNLRIKMGENGRKLLEREYDISKTIDIILNHM